MQSFENLARIGGRASALAIAMFAVSASPVWAQAAQPAQNQSSQLPAQVQPVPAPPPRAVAGEPTPAVSSYRINAGDELEIYVWGEERLQRQMKVLPDGTIAFPLVGQLRVAGQLPQDVERQVSERLRPQYRGEVPVVTVTVRQAAGMRFSVIGKVNSPGVFDTSRYINILEAIGQAGGPAEFANMDGISVIREEGGAMKSYPVRLSQLFRAGISENQLRNAGIIRILPGDVIIVP